MALFQANKNLSDSLTDPGGPVPVSVIIPAYNEAQGIGPQVAAVRRVLVEHAIPHEIIVVDDGSDDGTSQAALGAGAEVVQQPENRGYGAALKAGINTASHEHLVIIDADGTYPAREIPALLRLLDDADMAVGARIGSEVHVPLARRPAKWLLTKMAVRIAGRPIPDLNSGLRVFRREVVRQYFPILSNQFSFTTTITLAYLADGYRVVYHPIDYYQRVGRSKIVPRHFMDFIMLLLRTAILFEPMKIFVPVALALGGLGALKVLFDVLSFGPRTGSYGISLIFQPVISTSAILLLLAALQVLLFGMVADGLIRRIARHGPPLIRSRGLRYLAPAADAGTAPTAGPVEESALAEEP
jgi:glycosyltransferase involved in cell wall biosynthesis